MIKQNIGNFEVLLKVECTIEEWIKLLEKVIFFLSFSLISFAKLIVYFISFFCKELVINQQLRRETETIGPSAELAHWKRILTRFRALKNEIFSSKVQAYLEYLDVSKSKLMKVC